MPQETDATPNTPADRANMIAVKNQHIQVLESNLAVLRSQAQILEENLEAYAAAERAAIRELATSIANLERTIESEAEALFHLQSTQAGRPAPRATVASVAQGAPAAAPAASSAPQPARRPAPAPAPTRLATSTVPSKDEGPVTQDEIDFWMEKARRGEAGVMADVDEKGKRIVRKITPADIPDIARMAEGFPVQRPPREATLEGVKKTKKVAQWEIASDPDFSAADHVDQHGNRFVIDGKRHVGRVRIFDQHNRLVFDEAIESEWGKQAIQIADEDRDTSPELLGQFIALDDTEPPAAPPGAANGQATPIEPQ